MSEIETTRLRLRHLTLDDLDDLFRIYGNPEVMRYVGKGARTKAEILRCGFASRKDFQDDETQAALVSMIKHWEHGFGMWATIYKDSGKLIGRCGLCFLDDTPEVELGYTLDKPYWNMGLASEASKASLMYGFEEVGLERIVAIAKPENLASQRVMQKVGMKYQNHAHYYNTDVVYYALSRADYYARN